MKLCGIYKITCLANNKVYIGSSSDIKGRWSKHKYELNKQYHHNKYLQNTWNKYGQESFLFEIVELCSEEEIIDKEQFWIEQTGSCNSKLGFNMEGARRTDSVSCKEYIVTQPDGKEIVITNLNKFCRDNNLITVLMRKVLKGHYSNHNGWKCRHASWSKEEWENKLKEYNPVYSMYIVTHPDGSEEKISSLNDFCNKNKLSVSIMRSVVSNYKKQHKGFKCRYANQSKEQWESLFIKERKCRYKRDFIVTKTDGTEEIIHSLSKYCKDNNLKREAMSRLANNGCSSKSYKGYRCRHAGYSKEEWDSLLEKEKWENIYKESYIITRPDGENDLDASSLSRVHKGRCTHHKGYKCRKLLPEESLDNETENVTIEK